MMMLGGCVKIQSQVVVITATPTFQSEHSQEASLIPTVDQFSEAISATSTPVVVVDNLTGSTTYVVQPGDTLTGIASQHDTRLETLLTLNNITDPNLLSVGQVLLVPSEPNTETPSHEIVPDARLVRGPDSQSFDITSFINNQQGYIRLATDTIDDKLVNSVDVIKRVSMEFSVDPRLLLSILEYRSKWLTESNPENNFKKFPIQGTASPDGIDRSGLYKQLAWTANQLNAGYYGWKYKDAKTIEFEDGTRLRFANNLNAGTVGVQYFFSLQSTYPSWLLAVGIDGLYKTYASFFGDPFLGPVDILVPTGLEQPILALPFPAGQMWFFTGGSHGGWGSDSAWAAIDFAPPDDRPENSAACYVSEFWATAVAPGVITRSADGVVVLDLDGDGDETTGWTILYLHMASAGRVASGVSVNRGDQIGHPSCEGGFSNGTHMHMARRYNGEWIPVNCDICKETYSTPPFVMSNWTFFGLTNQEYQGYMLNNGDRREAEQGRLTPINRISW